MFFAMRDVLTKNGHPLSAYQAHASISSTVVSLQCLRYSVQIQYPTKDGDGMGLLDTQGASHSLLHRFWITTFIAESLGQRRSKA